MTEKKLWPQELLLAYIVFLILVGVGILVEFDAADFAGEAQDDIVELLVKAGILNEDEQTWQETLSSGLLGNETAVRNTKSDLAMKIHKILSDYDIVKSIDYSSELGDLNLNSPFTPDVNVSFENVVTLQGGHLLFDVRLLRIEQGEDGKLYAYYELDFNPEFLDKIDPQFYQDYAAAAAVGVQGWSNVLQGAIIEGIDDPTVLLHDPNAIEKIEVRKISTLYVLWVQNNRPDHFATFELTQLFIELDRIGAARLAGTSYDTLGLPVLGSEGNSLVDEEAIAGIKSFLDNQPWD